MLGLRMRGARGVVRSGVGAAGSSPVVGSSLSQPDTNRTDTNRTDVTMTSPAALVLLCSALFAAAAATDVQQCPGKSFQSLKDNVALSPCKKPPCKLKKGTNQHITIKFTPEKDVNEVMNHVAADVFGVSLPFVGVDGNSICDKVFLEEGGEKASCPLKAGTTYIYKDQFPVLQFYPSISVRVHWALKDGDADIVCFEVPARIS